MKKKIRFIKKQIKDIIIIFLLIIIVIFAYQYSKLETQKSNKNENTNEILQLKINNSSLFHQTLRQAMFYNNYETNLFGLKTAELILNHSDYSFNEELNFCLRNVQAVFMLQEHKKDIDIDQNTKDYIQMIKSDIIEISQIVDLYYKSDANIKTEEDYNAYNDERYKEIIELTEHINNYCEVILNGN